LTNFEDWVLVHLQGRAFHFYLTTLSRRSLGQQRVGPSYPETAGPTRARRGACQTREGPPRRTKHRCRPNPQVLDELVNLIRSQTLSGLRPTAGETLPRLPAPDNACRAQLSPPVPRHTGNPATSPAPPTGQLSFSVVSSIFRPPRG
jgi:hypothetical protein